MSQVRPLPVIPPELVSSDIFWAHARSEELVFQRCASDHMVFYPRGHCTTCGTSELRLLLSKGQGAIYTFTVIHAHPDAYFAARAPYIVGVIELDEGFRMLSEIRGVDPVVDGRVRLAWDRSPDLPVPVFETT